jgi:2-polyprenyl-3-methyl-5-hydroxy-6-metoxy-1,4-benzoquinol methylase
MRDCGNREASQVTDDAVSAAAHYERLLAEHYSWMLGDHDEAVAAQRAILSQLGVRPARRGGRALDLGAGSGVQSIALAEFGYAVTAVDSSVALLDELEMRSHDGSVLATYGDIRALDAIEPVRAVHDDGGFDVVVCMGDTITHLDSADEVARVIGQVYDLLAAGGLFAITYRDLTTELTGLDRFIPVRSDANRVMTCFLEYDDARRETVHVHDLVYVRDGERWGLRTSSYRKLRLSVEWMTERLTSAGFEITHCGPAGRFVGVVAKRPG